MEAPVSASTPAPGLVQLYFRQHGNEFLMPLVSVIMNIRNGAVFLREAMNSVMAQTFAGLELIVWDDCSTDDSAAIVAEYKDPRVRYFLSPEETPLGKARDNAMRQARGRSEE